VSIRRHSERTIAYSSPWCARAVERQVDVGEVVEDRRQRRGHAARRQPRPRVLADLQQVEDDDVGVELLPELGGLAGVGDDRGRRRDAREQRLCVRVPDRDDSRLQLPLHRLDDGARADQVAEPVVRGPAADEQR
jgi:hypothetical protein